LVRLASLLLKPDFQFVSLQKEFRDADRAALRKFPALFCLEDTLSNFADTAVWPRSTW
jgi:hypothetical protein